MSDSGLLGNWLCRDCRWAVFRPWATQVASVVLPLPGIPEMAMRSRCERSHWEYFSRIGKTEWSGMRTIYFV